MEESHLEREARAARNQSLFRSVNEKLQLLNESFAVITEKFSIACECADRRCIEMIEIHPHEYTGVRGEPRHFVVVPDHVLPDVERVALEADNYFVVEKLHHAGEVAELLAPEGSAEHESV